METSAWPNAATMRSPSLHRMALPVQHTSNAPANVMSIVRDEFLRYSRIAYGLASYGAWNVHDVSADLSDPAIGNGL